uniref:Uncharacterized protein n=1 Tax=Fagus sylvatica TaxID=28930 RepID=A0A2N9H975_FAGSY
MTVLRELWYCHVAVLSFHASSSSNPPRFPCAYPFLSDFRGQFWRSSGTQNGSCGISSESSRRPLSNDIKFARIGVRTRELWLPEVGVSELFLCTFPVKIPVKRGNAIGEPRVPRRSRSHYLSNAPGLADQLVASRKDSAREGGSCAAYFCKVPDSRESELGLVRYGPASRVHRGVFGPFEGSFPIGIPAGPDKFLAIREFHVVHGCVLFPMCPGSQINLLRVRKTLCASVATSALHRGEFGFARYDPANGGRRNVPYAKGGGQFDPVFGLVNGPVKPWSNLVNLGQTWSNFGQSSPNSWRCIPGLHFKGFWARWTLVGLETARSNLGQTLVNSSQTWSTLVKLGQTLGNVSRTFFLGVFDADEPSSDQTGLVRAVSFCAPTLRENPGGKNGVMTVMPRVRIGNGPREGVSPDIDRNGPREGLTYEIAKPKVWDASALRPSRQSNNHLNGARMASKAHKAKVPQEWTTWNATIGDKPKKGKLNSHDPKPIHPRFETWVVTQVESSPFRDLGGHPGRFVPDLRLGWSPKPNHPRFETWVVTQADRPRFETWVVTQAKSSPIRDLSGHSGRIIPDLGGHPSQIIPISRPGWSPRPIRPRFETWVVTQAESSLFRDPGWSPRPIRPRFETWVVTQAKSSPIRDLSGHSGRIIPGLRLRWSPKPNDPHFETWVVTQADSSPIRPRFETWVVTQADSSPI